MRLRERLRRRIVGKQRKQPAPTPLAPDAEAILASMYAWEPQPGNGDALHPLDGKTRVARERGDLLYRHYREVKPELSIEIGLAYGFSTVFLLSALREQAHGHHIAIDPFQSSSWHGVGVAKVRQLGMAERFTLIEEPSHLALPRLCTEQREAQFVFIDGDHRFDGAFVDFTLADHLLGRGGVVVFDDLWMPALRRVVAFIESNRGDYERLPSEVESLAVFRKIEATDDRPWDHYVSF